MEVGECSLEGTASLKSLSMCCPLCTSLGGKNREKEREGGTDTEGRERTQKVNVPKVWDLLPWESPSQEKFPCPLTNLEAK